MGVTATLPELSELTLQVLKFLSFNGINYKSHAKVRRTFKLNSQCHDSVPLMAL